MGELPLTAELASLLVEAATAAPSFRNSQPWWFLVRPDDAVIELHADPAQLPPRTDPDGRAAHISCGAALFNLRLAVTCAKAEPVTRLLPDPVDPRLLATVRLAGPHRPRARELDLYAALWRRHAEPGRGSAPLLSAPLLAALAEAAALEGATLFPRGREAVLATATAGRVDWLRAGQALERVLLLATQHGAVAGPLHEALDIHATGPATSLGGQHPQLALSLGHGPPGPATPRRPVAEVLRIASALMT
jgi:nitroreductase